MREIQNMAARRTKRIAVVGVVLATLATAMASPAAAQTGWQITESGIGPAVVGSTAAQLRTQLGPDYTVEFVGTVLVDVQGYEVRRGAQVLFIAAAVTGVDEPSPSEPLDLFIVREPGLATAEGVGVGTTMAEAITTYGAAVARFSFDNEGREFVDFERQPAGVIFRTGTGANAGIYEDGAEPSEGTTNIVADAAVTAVWLQCNRTTGCPPQPNVTVPGTVTLECG